MTDNKNKLQNSDFILPGNLGSVKIASTGKVGNVTKLEKNNADGSVTITVSTVPDPNDLGNGWYNGYRNFKDLWVEPKDAEFEVIEPKQLPDKPVTHVPE